MKSSKRGKPKGFWIDIENRRKFFSEFAHSKGFDPLDFQKWKQFAAVDVIQHQVPFLSFTPTRLN